MYGIRILFRTCHQVSIWPLRALPYPCYPQSKYCHAQPIRPSFVMRAWQKSAHIRSCILPSIAAHTWYPDLNVAVCSFRFCFANAYGSNKMARLSNKPTNTQLLQDDPPRLLKLKIQEPSCVYTHMQPCLLPYSLECNC